MEQLTDLKAILHSKRANIYYLEKCRVMQKDGRVLYLTGSQRRKLLLEHPYRQHHCHHAGHRHIHHPSRDADARQCGRIGRLLWRRWLAVILRQRNRMAQPAKRIPPRGCKKTCVNCL